MDPGAEIIDVVDRNDRVIGYASRAEVRTKKLLHRGATILCRNSHGAIYVHRRTGDKDVFPGMYDACLGGMVGRGESYEVAARRELAEELGIADAPLCFVFKHLYRGGDNPCWTEVYEVTWDGPVAPQAEEIALGEFMEVDSLRRRLEEWTFTPDGREVIERYLIDR
jgi:isopentenyldiphosphate isomerase